MGNSFAGRYEIGMKQLEQTVPAVYRGLVNEDLVVKETDVKFNHISLILHWKMYTNWEKLLEV